jgi:hypothetical protein
VYNPENLSPEQAKKVGQVCQEVMGFRPTAAETTNAWPGDPDPARQTNSYRGCVAAISQALVRKADEQRQANGERACRAKSLVAGTPAFSECVLNYGQSSPAGASGVTASSLVVAPYSADAVAGGKTPAVSGREQQACVDIGLEPSTPQFEDCVGSLSDVITARMLNKDYAN